MGERKVERILTSLLSWVENERKLLMIHGTDLEKGICVLQTFWAGLLSHQGNTCLFYLSMMITRSTKHISQLGKYSLANDLNLHGSLNIKRFFRPP